ncbi:hypothetical protein D3C72_1678610 [compost metagenome]
MPAEPGDPGEQPAPRHGGDALPVRIAVQVQADAPHAGRVQRSQFRIRYLRADHRDAAQAPGHGLQRGQQRRIVGAEKTGLHHHPIHVPQSGKPGVPVLQVSGIGRPVAGRWRGRSGIEDVEVGIHQRQSALAHQSAPPWRGSVARVYPDMASVSASVF